MQVGRQAKVRAGSGVPTTNPNYNLFSATLAQNAGLNGRVKLPEAIASGRTAQAILKAITITSFDNLAWELWLWGNSGFQSGHPDQDDFRGFWSFIAADAKQIAGTGLWYYYIDGLGAFYEDSDAGLTTNVTNQIGAYLNVTLVNRSAGAKTVNQWFDIAFFLEPTTGW